MASSNICWGVEIGYGAIKALKLEADGDDLNVLEFAVVNHPKVLSTPELDKDDAMRVALGTLASQYDLSGASLAISVPGHQAFARFAKLPPVEPKKIPDIVKFEAVQQIPFPLEEVEWDFQTFASPDSPDVEVGIFAITRQRISERLAMLQDLGLTPDFATLSPVAAYNALANDLDFTEKTPGTIIVDVGTVATDLIIAEAGRVWVRTFPIGGHQFTEALVNTFKLTYPKAEKLKREAEQSKHARHVFQAMRPVFSDLVQEIQRSIGYYQSVHPDASLQRLIGLGSTFRLPGLRKYIKQQLQIDVYRLEQFKRLKIDGPRAGEFQDLSLNLATAYGLAVQGLGRATLRANLMPVHVLREAMWKRKVGWFAMAAGVAAAASAAMFIRPLMDQTAVQAAERPAVITQVVRDAEQVEQRAREAGVIGDAPTDTTASTIIGLLNGRGLYAHILEDVGSMLAHADREASDAVAPAFKLVSMETAFVGAGDDAGAADDFGAVPQQPWMQQPGGWDDPDPGAADADGPGFESKPRVRVTVRLTTSQPNPRDLIFATIEEWIREHRDAAREGAPYWIGVEGDGYVFESVAGDRRDTPQFGRSRDDRRTPGALPPHLQHMRDQMPDPRTDARRPGMTGGEGLDRVAPLPTPEEDERPLTGTVTVTWYAVLGAPETADEGGED